MKVAKSGYRDVQEPTVRAETQQVGIALATHCESYNSFAARCALDNIGLGKSPIYGLDQLRVRTATKKTRSPTEWESRRCPHVGTGGGGARPPGAAYPLAFPLPSGVSTSPEETRNAQDAPP